MSKPTPRPWIVRVIPVPDGINFQQLMYSTGKLRYPEHLDEAQANATHIVRCVNMHDELIKTIREMLDYVMACKFETEEDRQTVAQYYMSVIAKAEGRDETAQANPSQASLILRGDE